MLASHVHRESCVRLLSDDNKSIEMVRNICEYLDIELDVFEDVNNLRDIDPNQPTCILCVVENDKSLVHHLLDSPVFDTLAIPVIIGCSKLTANEVIRLMEQNVFKILHENLQESDLKYWIQKALIFEQDRINLIKNYNQTNMALEKLSIRQLQVLKDILKGKPTKSIAIQMKLSQRMIEKERSYILNVFGANSTSEVTLKIGEYRVLKKMQHRIDPAHDTATQLMGHLRNEMDSPLKQFLQRFGDL